MIAMRSVSNQEMKQVERERQRAYIQQKKLEKRLSRIEKMIQNNVLRLDYNFKRTEQLQERFFQSIERVEQKSQEQLQRVKMKMERKIENSRDDLMTKIETLSQMIREKPFEPKEHSQDSVRQIGKQMKETENKLNVLKERCEEEKGKINSQMIEQKMERCLIDLRTPSIKNLKIEEQLLTLQKGGEGWQRVLFDVVVKDHLTLQTYIQYCYLGNMNIGVVDRKQPRTSSIYYSGRQGFMYMNKKKVRKGDDLQRYMQVVMEIDRIAHSVTFTLIGGHEIIMGEYREILQPRSYTLNCPILSEPDREFVPFLQMSMEGDCVRWKIT